MKQRIGLGVIGINPRNMGSTVSLLRDVPDLRYDLRGVCARTAAVLADYARKLGCSFWTTDAHALCRRPDIDAVAVYSPDHLHAQHCTWAVGVHSSARRNQRIGETVQASPGLRSRPSCAIETG